jgi:hypothetical protein
MNLLPAAIGVQSGYVLAAITLFALPIAALAFARSGPAWQSIGKGPLAIEQAPPPSRSLQQPPAEKVDPALVAAEARQMLEAKAYMRRRRGAVPLDVEGEMRRALDSSPDVRPGIATELREEVRRLVIVRNERRLRRGQEPLDVEAETERQLADFIGSD